MYREQSNLFVNQVLHSALSPCIIPSCSNCSLMSIYNHLSPSSVTDSESKPIDRQHLISLLLTLAYIIPASHDILMIWFSSICCKLLSQDCSLPYTSFRDRIAFFSLQRDQQRVYQKHIFVKHLCCTIVLYSINST